MKAINVERDQQGMWVHPELPVWGENHSEAQAEAWFASQGLTHHLVLMEGELGERWGCGDLESCAEWQPETEVKDAFLVGIWDTEDGVVAMFASPLVIEAHQDKDVRVKLMFSSELECWEICYGKPLTLGLKVKTTDTCEHTDFRGGEFYITSITFDSEGVNIGINNNGDPDDFETQYDGFRIDELALVS